MVQYFKNYIEEYVHDFQGPKIAGEHHFVATYLVPKIFSISKRVPDYVNPDGMKNLPGDILFYDKSKCVLSIEVKLLKINFTKVQFKNWIFPSNQKEKPMYLIALGKNGLIVVDWKVFQEVYLRHLKNGKNKSINNNFAFKYNTPILRVDDLISEKNSKCNIFNAIEPQKIEENKFEKKLRALLNPVILK